MAAAVAWAPEPMRWMASAASSSTSWLLRRCPEESLTLMPIWANSSFPAAMFFSRNFIPLASWSLLTPVCWAAKLSRDMVSTDSPVRRDIRMICLPYSTVLSAAPLTRPTTATAAAASATVDTRANWAVESPASDMPRLYSALMACSRTATVLTSAIRPPVHCPVEAARGPVPVLCRRRPCRARLAAQRARHVGALGVGRHRLVARVAARRTPVGLFGLPSQGGSAILVGPYQLAGSGLSPLPEEEAVRDSSGAAVVEFCSEVGGASIPAANKGMSSATFTLSTAPKSLPH